MTAGNALISGAVPSTTGVDAAATGTLVGFGCPPEAGASLGGCWSRPKPLTGSSMVGAALGFPGPRGGHPMGAVGWKPFGGVLNPAEVTYQADMVEHKPL